MKAFLTGSRAYGTPKPDSDIDLVVLVDPEAAELLWALSDTKGQCRFGKINLITFSNQDNFARWEAVTKELITRKPVTRDDAVAAFQLAGFGNYPTQAEDKKDAP